MAESGQTVEDNRGYSDTETTEGTVWSTERQWTDCKEKAEGIVTQNQETVQCEVLTYSGQSVEESSGHSDTKPSDGTV